MKPLFRTRKCPTSGCPARPSVLEARCASCQDLLDRAARAHPLPAVDPHPVEPTFAEMWDRVTPEFEQSLLDADGPHNAQRAARCAAAEALRQRALLMVVSALGLDHPAVSALRRAEIRHVPRARGADQVRSWRDKREQAAQQARVVENAREQGRKAERARTFLRSRGLDAAGSDQEVRARADEAASGARIRAAKALARFHDFDGRIGCSETCAGWDGSSSRCECGAHRLNWETHGDFEDGYVAARTC